MTYWLEQLTGKITMYRLVLYVLAGLFGFSLLLAVSGQLSFTFWELCASAAVIAGVSYCANRLLGWIYGVKPQADSSLISGLILFFIFSPTVEPKKLAILALVALFAQASKYVLTFRKRHVFNPVAIAAVVIGTTGLMHASWWVATPVLIPATVLGLILVLHKTRRTHMALLFICLAYALTVLHGVLQGEALSYIVVAGITSWPILFFAGFMLTEPLTLPPRKSQQLTLAALVAIIFTTPLHTSIFSMAPEIALVISNIVAFSLGPRRGLNLVLASVTQLTPTTKSFIFNTPGTLHFTPGQYIELALPHKHVDSRGVRRMFSLVSQPDQNQIEIAVKIPEPCSTFKQKLANLTVGDRVHATTVSGDFTLPQNAAQKVVLVAGGIGVTPYISQLREATATGSHRDIVLVYAVANTDELAYVDVIRESGVRVIVVSEHIQNRVVNWEYIAQPFLDLAAIQQNLPDVQQRIAYISGPPPMVEGLKKTFKKAGAKGIKTDFFSGY